ncbi:tetratricopeptide repeat protein [Pseudomonas benzenivorans]|uniref:Tetratricopeptide repeat protein n=1 Tax=Pseudomonas benzenivorans TaxID=556533 RepID=A0ABZ0PTT8_9PSED|nr:tetratricopeptide repeat protein [Pseudomonas benzenivorans]WPC04590.1 tetratricopeptide repeat protein [Pseudomonas benzenivorans]
MSRLLLSLLLCAAGAVQAATQSIEPGVFRALNQAQTAQQQGDYATARRALDGAKARPGSLEQALLWRSRGYLAWAQGQNAQAIDWLDKALASGRLDAESQVNERLNLARLNLVERRYARVVELLAPQQAGAAEEVLQLLVQAYQGQGQPAKALPLAERYVQANPRAADSWLQFLVAVNAELKRYPAAERWQRQLLARQPDDSRQWRQLAALQQMAGRYDRALATLRAAYAKGLRFSAAELDNLVVLAGAAGQPWQGAQLLAGLLDSGLLANSRQRQERLGLFWWQARERSRAAAVLRPLAERTGSGELWLQVAQLELEQHHWKAGLAALNRAEGAGAPRSKVRSWRQWAESELRFEQDNRLASRH